MYNMRVARSEERRGPKFSGSRDPDYAHFLNP